MLPSLFSFSGRIGRLEYVLGSLVISFGSIVPAFLLAGFAMAMCATRGGLALVILMMIAFGGAVIWATLALQVRRCRDIGWDPFVIGGWMAAGAFDVILARLLPSLAAGKDGHGTLIGALVNLAFLGALLFWPGRNGRDVERAPPGPMPTSRVEALRAALPAGFAEPRPIAAHAAVPARTGFGRRAPLR